MRLINSGLMAAMVAGAVVLAAGCSSDDNDGRRGRVDRSDRYDGSDNRSAREKLDRRQGDYADRNRDGVRDGDQNNGRGVRGDSDMNR